MRIEVSVGPITVHVQAVDPAALALINQKLDAVLAKEMTIMATLDDVLAGVGAEGTKEDSLIQLVENLAAQVAAITSGALPPAVQAKVDAVFAAVTSNSAKVQAEIDKNTTPPPPPPAP